MTTLLHISSRPRGGASEAHPQDSVESSAAAKTAVVTGADPEGEQARDLGRRF